MEKDKGNSTDLWFADDHPKHGRRVYRLERPKTAFALFCNDVPIPAPPNPLRLLEYMLSRKFGMTLSKEDAAEAVWTSPGYTGDIDGLILDLRNLLEDTQSPRRLVQRAGVKALRFGGKEVPVESVANGRPDQLGSAGDIANQRTIGQTEPSKLKTWTFPLGAGCFTGREQFLTDLHEGLQKERRVIITAGGGCGKTQTAIEYVKRLADAYEDVLWIRASDAPSLFARAQEVAATLERPSQSDADVQRSWQRWMSEHPKALLVFDSLDDPASAKPFWPTGPVTPYVLVTSRRKDLDELGHLHRMELRPWDETEAVTFLERRTRSGELTGGEKEAMKALAVETGFWPLALEQTAAFIAVTQTPFASYLKAYHRLRVALFSRTDHRPVAGDYSLPVTLTWKASLASVPAAARDLLVAASHLAPVLIPFELFTHAPELLTEDLKDALADSSAADPIGALVGQLQRFSLIQVDRDSNSFSIHSLLHEVVRVDQTSDQQADWISRWVQVFRCFLPTTPATEGTASSGPYSRTEAGFQALFTRMPKLHPSSVEAARIAARYVHYLQNCGRFASAETIALPEIEIFERVLGKEHETTLRAQQNLGRAYRFMGRFADAMHIWKHVREVRERTLGGDHPETVAILNALVIAHRDRGQYTEAEALGKSVLETRERLLGPDHPDTLDSLTNLGVIYRDQGRYKESESLCVRAFKDRVRALGSEHADTLGALANLTEVVRLQGRLQDALALSEQVLDARKRILGTDHPYTLRSVSEQASLLAGLGKYAEAEPLFVGLVEARERVQGSNHPETIGACSNLAVLYRLQQHYNLAEPLLQKALDGYTRLVGPNSPDTLSATFYLGELYVTQGRLAEAEPLCERAFDGRKTLLGEHHPDTLSALGILALMHRLRGQFDSAAPLFQRVLEGREIALGKDHPDTIDAMIELAELRRCQSRIGEAKLLSSRALEAGQRALGSDHAVSIKAQTLHQVL